MGKSPKTGLRNSLKVVSTKVLICCLMAEVLKLKDIQMVILLIQPFYLMLQPTWNVTKKKFLGQSYSVPMLIQWRRLSNSQIIILMVMVVPCLLHVGLPLESFSMILMLDKLESTFLFLSHSLCLALPVRDIVIAEVHIFMANKGSNFLHKLKQ